MLSIGGIDHSHGSVWNWTYDPDDPMLAPNKIMQQVKGYSSRQLRDEFDFGLPSLWTRSYFVSSAVDVSSEVIEEYIDAQAGEEPIKTG
jgi:REP element-mobilizing transposase RayT